MNALLLAETGGQSLTIYSLCGDVLHIAALVIAAIGVLVITYGVLRGGVSLVQSERKGSTTGSRNKLRMDLGYYLLLGLEILVAADILETLLAPDLEHIALLGAIVVIRTVISVSLNWELNQHAKHETPA